MLSISFSWPIQTEKDVYTKLPTDHVLTVESVLGHELKVTCFICFCDVDAIICLLVMCMSVSTTSLVFYCVATCNGCKRDGFIFLHFLPADDCVYERVKNGHILELSFSVIYVVQVRLITRVFGDC